MKKLLIINVLVTLLSISANAQQERRFAVGFKVGEPLGINARYYFKDNRALDFNVGTYGGLWGTTRKYGASGKFQNVGWAMNLNYVFHTENSKKKLSFSYGVGGQITGRRSYPDRLAGQFEKRTGLGGNAIAGVAYALPNSPVSVFADAGLYVELLPVPFFMHVQGGLGARFNF